MLGDDLVTGSKMSRKPNKDDPRLDFVNEYFKQNLNPGTLNPNTLHHNGNSGKKDMSSSKMMMRSGDPHKNAFMSEWQNDLLRNLQDNTKNKKSGNNRD